MAKVKSSGLRNYVGRLAGNVYYINKGQNIARELAPQVSNPQTEAQMDQRIKLSNVVAMYRLNSGWMKDHAFPNRPQNQSIYNAFVAANLAGSQVALTKEDAARGYCVVAPYEMTKGSLPRVQIQDEEPDQIISTLKCGEINLQTTTVAEVSQSLIENNPFLQDGDQISFVLNFQYNDVAGIYAQCVALEFTLDLTSDNLFKDDAFGGHGFSTEVTEGSNVLYLAIAADELPAYASSDYIGAACIISRKTSSGIQVSPSTMVLVGDYRLYTTMTSEARKRLARNSYGVSTEPFLVPGEGGSGDTPTPTPTVPVEFDFEFPTTVAGLSTKHITLTNGLEGEVGLVYLKEHLTFDAGEGGTLTIAVGVDQSSETYYYLTDGTDEYNTFSYSSPANVYRMSTIAAGPDVVKPLWDGEEF